MVGPLVQRPFEGLIFGPRRDFLLPSERNKMRVSGRTSGGKLKLNFLFILDWTVDQATDVLGDIENGIND